MANQNNSLAGKKIIVLGGSSGLGLATAQAANAEGAKLIIVSSNLQRVNKALETLDKNSEGVEVDLRQEENIRKFFDHAGNFDHLVYTAGENISLGTIDKTSLADARNFFNLRYWGAFTAVKYAAANINKGGSISLTSGTAGLRPRSGWTIASSICGAMEGFVKSAAVELAPIRVNCVVPGIVKTNLWNSLTATDRENLYKSGDDLLVKRVGEAEDIANAFLYLMKQQYGTGQSIVIDGGGILT